MSLKGMAREPAWKMISFPRGSAKAETAEISIKTRTRVVMTPHFEKEIF
jgi:hypothetical protein